MFESNVCIFCIQVSLVWVLNLGPGSDTSINVINFLILVPYNIKFFDDLFIVDFNLLLALFIEYLFADNKKREKYKLSTIKLSIIV